jgi:hypothetical protein
MTTYARVQGGFVLGYENFDGPIDNQATLPPGKPKLLPVVEINKSYDPVTQIQVMPPAVAIEATRVTWTYTNRPKNAAEIDGMRNEKLAAVRTQADLRLTKIDTFTQQSWALTRLVQMLYANTDWHSWPSQPQIDLATTMLSRLNNLVAVRQAEDTKMKELQGLTDPTAINNYNATTGWPA